MGIVLHPSPGVHSQADDHWYHTFNCPLNPLLDCTGANSSTIWLPNSRGRASRGVVQTKSQPSTNSLRTSTETSRKETKRLTQRPPDNEMHSTLVKSLLIK